MQEQMDALFDEFFTRWPGRREGRLLEDAQLPAEARMRQPEIDLFETDKDIIVTAELPGARKEDIHVNATEGELEIRVEVKREEKDEHRHTRSYQGYYRTIPLPDYADTERIDASYNNGVLELKIPIAEKKKQARRIQIK